MIRWFVWGAMDLARMIEYAVQTGRSRIVSFERLLPLTGFGVAESGIDSRIFDIVAIVPMLVSVAPELAGAVFGLGGSCFVGCVCPTSQPTILSRAKASHKCREGGHGSRLFLAKVAGKPFVSDAVFECR